MKYIVPEHHRFLKNPDNFLIGKFKWYIDCIYFYAIYCKIHYRNQATFKNMSNVFFSISPPFSFYMMFSCQKRSTFVSHNVRDKSLNEAHSVVFFKFCNTDKYPKCIGLEIGDFAFLYVFVYRSKSICSRETYNTSLESSFL